ncbi:MAG: TonB-dependent receptor plug domain-containing protein, partial [Bacteroidales bacterium]|nr:TonB-dependent receptor plug domain-containing protein [Bacteroidales bacterium]
MTKTFETKSLRVLKLAVCFVLLSFGLMATVPAQGAVPQNVTVSGVVADVNGEPIIGASVLQDGTLNGTVTDIDGRYTLTVPANSKIAFSFIGYVTQVLDVNGRTRINVTLNEDTVLLDDVVVVGFGTQTKANLTGAVSAVDSKVLNDRPIRDLNQGLQGATPGLTVLYTSGRLGDEPTMNIRGTGSLSGGSPLVLVDGVQSSLSMVNPDDVESISVLKDAASASIYGSRAAFGVILITTKQGTEDQLKFDFTASVGLAMLGDMPTVADPEKFFRSAYENYRHYPDWTGAAPESWGRYYHINLPVVQAWKQQYAGKIDPLD